MNMRSSNAEAFELPLERLDEDLRLTKFHFGDPGTAKRKSRVRVSAWGLATVAAAIALGVVSPLALMVLAGGALLLLALATSVCLYALNNTR